jgi:hypothetical protein
MTVPILPCGGNSNTQVGKRAKKIRMEATRSAMVGKYQDADCLLGQCRCRGAGIRTGYQDFALDLVSCVAFMFQFAAGFCDPGVESGNYNGEMRC